MESSVVHQQNRVRQVLKGIVLVGAFSLTVLAQQFQGRVDNADSRVFRSKVAEAVSQRDDAGARAAFLVAYTVLKHPRCMNCHPVANAPLQGDDSHPHAQSVKRGVKGHGKYGMKCTACHQLTNLPGENMPPGVSSEWHMPPADMPMVFEGRSAGELCRQLKDPRKNGGRTGEKVIEHLEADPLVLWGWSPGDGRSTPPISHAEFLQKMREWVNKGGACPE
jgi:hypothetical protein